MIRTALVEDDRTVRQNLAALIERAPGFTCVAACASAEEAMRVLPLSRPEVVLMDIHLPGRTGIECLEWLREALPKTQVVMLTVEENSELVFESLKAGATGYLVKNLPPQEILEAVREVHSGGAPMTSHVARRVVAAFRETLPAGAADLPVSPRELEILRLLARGFRTKEIADTLGIGSGTVNTHIRHIYERLHVRSRAEAVARLREL